MKNKVVIITGSSGGIGKALALKFASEGNHVIINGRNLDKLKSLSDIMKENSYSFLAVPGDVSKAEDCKNLVNVTVKEFGRIDVLINNAGMSMRALFTATNLDVFKVLMAVNFWGAVYCTRYAIEHLLKSKGSVVGISSIAGKKGLPGRTGYSASKYAMEGFLESLRLENRKTGLHVLIACPGFTATSIRKSALDGEGNNQAESPRNESEMMTSKEVADKIYVAICKRKRDIVLTRQGKLIVLVNKFFPKFVDKRIFHNMSKEQNSPF